MKKQLHVGGYVEKDTFNKIWNVPYMNKPKGGLWTSSYHHSYHSQWVQWCHREEFMYLNSDIVKCSIVTVKSDARVVIIDSYADLEKLVHDYGKKSGHLVFGDHDFMNKMVIDFEKVSQDFDGIQLTSRGQSATRFSSVNLYGWDCECSLFLNWCFSDVKHVDIKI